MNEAGEGTGAETTTYFFAAALARASSRWFPPRLSARPLNGRCRQGAYGSCWLGWVKRGGDIQVGLLIN